MISWIFYRAERIGDSLPDGPVLLVANHPNGLLDPALIWTTAGQDIRFLAKSTLFQGSLMSPLVRHSGAIPVYRRIDQGADMSRNVEMFAAVEAALALNDAVCLFPEGISHSKGRLEQLRTGASRIALASAAKGIRVAIVPIGLNFDHKTIFRSRVTIAYGRPFFCDDLCGAYDHNPHAAVLALNERIADHLRSLMVEADPRTDAQLVDRIDQLYSAARALSAGTDDRLQRRRIIASGIERLRAHDPQQYELVREKLRLYDARLARFGLHDQEIDRMVGRGAAIHFAIREAALALALVPLALLGALIFAVPYWTTHWIARTQQHVETQATWKAVGGVIVYGVWGGVLATVVGLTQGAAKAILAFVLLPILAVSALIAIERETIVAETVRAYVAFRRAPSIVRRRLMRHRAEIADLLERVHEWLEGKDSANGST